MKTIAIITLGLASIAGSTAYAEDTVTLAQAAKNPLADLTNVQILYDANLNTGPERDTQQVLTLEPVIPVAINSQWSLITRTIATWTEQPPQAEGGTWMSGFGDIQLSAFVSPIKQVGGWDWGAGPVLQMPTASNAALGQGKWSAGPTAAAIRYDGPWSYGALINNVWSFAGNAHRSRVDQMQFEPLLSYNFPDNPDRTLTFSPTITADWEASAGERWTVPLSLGLGQVVKVGGQAINLQGTAYYYVDKPTGGPNWTLELQVQLLFPK